MNFVALFSYGGFRLSVESNSRLFWFLFLLRSMICSKNLRYFFDQSEVKTNRDMLAHVFPRAVPVTCICVEL